jgi:hypothetical protein
MSFPTLEILKDIHKRLAVIEKKVADELSIVKQIANVEVQQPVHVPQIDLTKTLIEKTLNQSKADIAEAKRTVTNVLTIKFESLIKKRFIEFEEEIAKVNDALEKINVAEQSTNLDNVSDKDIDLDIQIAPPKKRSAKK